MNKTKKVSDKELYPFPIMCAYMLGIFLMAFTNAYEFKWWICLILLVISTTIYVILLKWGRHIAYSK